MHRVHPLIDGVEGDIIIFGAGCAKGLPDSRGGGHHGRGSPSFRCYPSSGDRHGHHQGLAPERGDAPYMTEAAPARTAFGAGHKTLS